MANFRKLAAGVTAMLLLAGNVVGQILPPQPTVNLNERRRIGGEEGLKRVQEAIRALRVGDGKGMSAQIAGAEFEVSLSEEHQRHTVFASALLDYANSLQGRPQPLSNAMFKLESRIFLWRLDKLLPQDPTGEKGIADLGDAELLAGLIYLHRRISPMAVEHLRKATESGAGAPFATRLLAELRGLNGTIVRTSAPTKVRGLEMWRCQSAQAPQPIVVGWFEDVPPAGREEGCGKLFCALTVERNPAATQAKENFRIVFRDLDDPPLILAECGPELPREDELLEFAQQFSVDLPGTWFGAKRVRCQMEAVYAAQAELAPLAASWQSQISGGDSLLTEQVEKPLRKIQAWGWELRDRRGAGDLRGLKVVTIPAAASADRPQVRFEFQYGPAGPPTWEVMGYVNRDVERLESAPNGPDHLEHFHFAVGTGEERRHVASFRLVSDRVEGGDRLYTVQCLSRSEQTTLDVMSRSPSFDELRDRVLLWINAWPRPIVNSIGMRLVLIPAGEFTMGASPGDAEASDDEKPAHRVKITWPFYLSAYEVTQQEFRTVTNETPWIALQDRAYRKGDSYPATNITWNDATEFCKKLSAREGKKYRLPTEAEWEYACRAGGSTRFSFGDDASPLSDYAWFKSFSGSDQRFPYPEAVGKLKPSDFGLYDMHGNVKEWCLDAFDGSIYKARDRLAVDPFVTSGSQRVLRGGGFSDDARFTRSSARYHLPPWYGGADLGFRVVCETP